MAENINLSTEIIFSDTIEKDVKEEILDAINTSKDILSHIKENDMYGEKYKDALRDYNTLKIEIQEAYLDDKTITREELNGLRDEIASMESHDERSTFQKTIDSVGNYTNLTNTYEVINEVETKLKAISDNNPLYFYINESHISIISDPKKLDKILALFNSKGDTFSSEHLNLNLFNEFILKKGIDLEPEDITKISKENLEKNLGNLINSNKNSISVTIRLLYKACSEGIKPEKITKIMKETGIYDYQASGSNFIDNYIGRIEAIGEEQFKEIYEKYKEAINNGGELDQESNDYKTIKNFLIQNTNNEKYSNIINIFIINYNLGLEIPLNTKEKSIAFLESKSTSSLQHINKEFLGDKDIMDTFILNMDKDTSEDDILFDIQFINKNTNDINTSLSFLSGIKEKFGEELYNKTFKVFSTDNEILMSFISLIKNKTEIKNEYIYIFNDINEKVVNNIEKINDLISAKNQLNTNNKLGKIKENKEAIKQIFTQLSEKLDKNLDKLEPNIKKELLDSIAGVDTKITNGKIEEIYKIIKKSKDVETNFEIVLKTINEFKAEEDKKINEAFNGGGGNEKLKCSDKYKTNDKIDNNKIKEEYSKLIKGKTPEEQLIIRDNFINEEFPDANEEQKVLLEKMLIMDSIIDTEKITFVQNNIKKFVEYMDIKETNPDSKVDFKEFMEMKPKLDDPSNNFFIPSIESYTKTGSSYTLEGKHGEQIEGLTELEMKNTLGNPEGTENLINFYKFFKELNLEGVWEHRANLILGMKDSYINPNDTDSIKEEELRKFGNKLLTFIGNVDNKNEEGFNEKINLTNIGSVNSKLRSFSGAGSMVSDGATFNIEGEDKFTSYLRNNGIIGGAYFKINKFRELI